MPLTDFTAAVIPWITGPVTGPLLFGVYAGSVAIVTAYAVGQYHLLWRYFRIPARPVPAVPALAGREWPMVTVQIPLYNERYVAAEIIDACAALEYPADRLEIQVLDDSTDDTQAIVAERAAHWRAHGIAVTVCRRPTRDGYKAGALAAATPQAAGSLLALFDADFRPAPDFLRRCVPEFDAPQVGAVQARWGHLNRGYSILTLAQSLLHDAFFFVEQEARARSGFFVRFNGSAGIWRRATVNAAGGWSASTLSEDMDLAYRAQLTGWQIVYRRDVEAPAELPVTVADYHTQQHRWHKGRTQVVRQLLGPVWRAPLPPMIKAHALFDMLNAVVVPGVLMIALLAPWFTMAAAVTPWMQGPSRWFILSQINVLLLPAYAWVALSLYVRTGWPRVIESARAVPSLVLLFLGMNLSLCVALAEGFGNRPAEFRRTAKYRVDSDVASTAWRGSRYAPRRISGPLWGCVVVAAICAVYLWLELSMHAWMLMPFHAVLGTSAAFIFGQAVRGR